MDVSPGLSYILRHALPVSTIPPTVIYACYRAAERLGYDLDVIPESVRTPLGLGFLTLAYLLGKAVVTSTVRRIQLRRDMRRLGAVPIPVVKGKGWPLNVDVTLRFSKALKTAYAGGPVRKLMLENGDTFCLDMLGSQYYWTANPYLMKEILVTQFSNFTKGPQFHSMFDSFLGTGIFNSDGDAWKMHRSMTRPFFNRDRITDFDIFDHHSDVLLQKIYEKSQTGMAFDFQEAISQFTMDSATEFLLGTSVNSLATPLALPGVSSSDSAVNRFVSAFQATQMHIMTRVRSRWLPWQLNEIFGDPTKKHMKTMYAFIDPIIDVALEAARIKKGRAKGVGKVEEGGSADTSSGGEETLLSHLVTETQDRKMIRDEMLNILIAGRDTTAVNLTWNVYFLATHPDVCTCLRQEILDVVGPNQRPTFENIKVMKYLRAVINESLRVLPSVPYNLKHTIESTVLTNPETGVKYFLPAGSRVGISQLAMQTSPEFWGPTALEWDPNRWLDDRNKTYYLANPFIFLPFLAGPRICLGQQRFENIELALDAFPPGALPPAQWKTDAPSGTRAPYEKVWPKSHITTYSHGGMWVRVK
ncbi:hypothetical protein FRB96_002341 [Tulasnella sp. 330]|nr:hypothetical protein FRB96_002341 [Tulasnella sp. 330]